MIRTRLITLTMFCAVFITTGLFPQNGMLTDSSAHVFVHFLLTRNDSIKQFIKPGELEYSKRLGITYKGVWNKALISNDIDDALIPQISSGTIVPHSIITALEDGYSRLTLTFSGSPAVREYYFDGGLLVSPASYYARSWKRIESAHFVFMASNPRAINAYAIRKLERFVDSMERRLAFSGELRARLREKKIFYFLCDSDEEIKSLTGFSTMGMYYLPYDYIITTYNCHTHELLHLLINYKLQSNELFTHPFFQEGLAVALGGRGGKESGVILDMGAYLQTTGMMDFTELLSREQFHSQDASMSYAISGLYNRFLLERISQDAYIALYRKYSGSSAAFDKMIIDTTDLPERSTWLQYVAARLRQPDIIPANEIMPQSVRLDAFQISVAGEYYRFETKGPILINGSPDRIGHPGKKFNELFPGKKYDGEKYAIIASADEVSVYNLFTDNLIAKYVKCFTLNQQSVPESGGCFRFLVKKSVFDAEDKIITQ